MILARSSLMLLLNGLYDLGQTTITVEHPSDEIGELLRIRLDDTTEATVSVTADRYEYEDRRAEVEREYGDAAYDDLPDPQTYVRTLIAGGLFDVANKDEIYEFLRRHGTPDLEAGHDPVMAGIDTNLFGWQMPSVLDLDPGAKQYDQSNGRPPVTGFVLSSGVKEELDWHYKHYDTRELTRAFGDEFERLDNQPAGENREGFLGLYQFRRLMARRQTDFAYSDTGDGEIVQGYVNYQNEHRKEVLLFSNDTGFVERANDAGVKAQKVAFPANVQKRATVQWETVCELLYVAAVIFGVLVLPKATLYGVWNGKNGTHWKNQDLVIENRSPKLEAQLDRDSRIVDAYDG
ncbi:PIN domain-containing protein [Halorientalis persicus]|nr:PIN domain-containing protein [Halorientalis persicus]